MDSARVSHRTPFYVRTYVRTADEHSATVVLVKLLQALVFQAHHGPNQPFPYLLFQPSNHDCLLQEHLQLCGVRAPADVEPERPLVGCAISVHE